MIELVHLEPTQAACKGAVVGQVSQHRLGDELPFCGIIPVPLDVLASSACGHLRVPLKHLGQWLFQGAEERYPILR